MAVIGPGEQATAAQCATAFSVGQLLGERDVVVITGGLGGVMAAAAEGCASAGGVSVGLLPGPDRTGADSSSLAIPTGLGELRNALLVRSADGLVAVGGSWGTLSEIALARRIGRPLVCLGGWSIVGEEGLRLPLETAASAADAVDQILGLIG